jgi:hypothetical protein
MTIYLYVKTHNKTGLKYLGKTSKNPRTYLGSGIDWKAHLKEHGFDHSTEIIKECQDNQELNYWGRHYSDLWNVAESNEWANRIPETGGGTNHTEDRKELFRQQQLGRKKAPRTKEHTEKIANQLRGRTNPKVAKSLRKWYDSNPDRSKTIEKLSKSIKQWYIDNPELSHNKSLKTWDSRYQNRYSEYKKAVELVSLGFGVNTIQRETGMCLQQSSVNKLRSGEHRIYELFPELKEHLSV